MVDTVNVYIESVPDSPIIDPIPDQEIQEDNEITVQIVASDVDGDELFYSAIIDEAQNLTTHELKTIITRVGENTKIVLTGDIEQIDSVYLDSVSNGLSYAVEKFKAHGLAGHVTLKKGERSKVATLASKIL